MNRVTLAIPCFNAAPFLEQVLGGVARLSPAPDEVLLVDDGSADDSRRIARRLGARVVAHGDNRGLARTRNTCLEHAAGAIVIFIDADAVPDRDLVLRLTRPYDDPGVAAVGGQVTERTDGALPDRWRAHFWRQTQGQTSSSDATFVIGACCSFRRRAVLDAGGFDADYRSNGEDVEISARMRCLGHRLFYEPRARVTHLRRDSLGSLVSMIYRHSRDHVVALRAHRQPSHDVVLGAVRWGPVTVVSSVRRHRSPGLAVLSPICYAAALAGCARGLLGPAPRNH